MGSIIRKLFCMGLLFAAVGVSAGTQTLLHVDYISAGNIGSLISSSFTPLPGYEYEFVYGSKDVTDGSDFQAVRNAFGTWMGVQTADVWATETAGAGYLDLGMVNGRNEVSWVGASTGYNDPWSNILGLSNSIIAVSYSWYYPDDRLVVERDLYFNDVDMNWRTATDGVFNGGFNIEHIALHEIGHIFGLEDIYEPGDPGYESWMGYNNEHMTMYGYSSWQDDDITLSNEDILAISTAHPSALVPEPGSITILTMLSGFLSLIRKKAVVRVRC